MQGRHIGMVMGMLLCWAASAAAQNFPPALANSMPQVQYFHNFDLENQSLQLDKVHEVKEQVAIREVDAATGRERLIASEETRQIIDRRTYRLPDVRALSLSGDTLKLSDVLAKLQPDHPVIVLQKGNKIPRGYQKLLRDDVVILEIPELDPRPIVGTDGLDDRPRLSSPPLLPVNPAVTVAPPRIMPGPKRSFPSTPIQPVPAPESRF